MDSVRTAAVSLVALIALSSAATGCSDGAFATFNDVPGASILAPEMDAVFREGESVTLRGFVDDNRTRTADLLVSWSSSIEGQLFEGPPDDDAGATALSLVLEELGEHVITLRVVDPRGGIGTDSVRVTVRENAAPGVLLITPDTEDVYHSDVPVPLFGVVSDDEDASSDLRVTWTVDGEVFADDVAPDDAGYVSDVAALDEGTHTVALRVRDTDGKDASAQVTFAVRGPNSPPTCSLDLPTDGDEYLVGDPIEFLGTANDADVPSSALSVQWVSSADGVLGTSVPEDSGSVAFTGAALTGGTPTITMTVTDEVGVNCSDSVSLVVESPPSVVLLAPVAGSVVPIGGVVMLESQVSDVQDGPESLTILWSSSVDGDIGFDFADATGFQTGSTPGLSAGTHVLTVSVTDTAGLTSVASSQIVINGPPSAPVVEIGPNPAASGDDLTAAVVTPAVDPEGDPLTYVWSWSRDGVPMPTLAGATVVPASETSQGEAWEVTAVASDGWSTGPGGSASLVVGNGAPIVTAPTMSPTALLTETLVTCSGAVGSDPDGDPVTLLWSWEVNGATVPVYTPALSGVSWFDKGDTVQCFVTPDDGLVLGATVGSGAVLVQNTAPTAPTVGITPAAPNPDDALTCALVAPSTDADPLDSLTHTWAWLVNGTAAGISGPNVAAALTADQDQWTCQVSATDGTATSPVGTATATVCLNETWYLDGDGDGFGDFATEVVACAAPVGYVPEAGDCDDTDATIYPTAGDTATDTVDTDCDGMDCEAGDLNGTYYVVCLDNGDWFDAQTACQSAGYDGLATFVSAAEETFVVGLLVASGGASQDPWLGLTDQGTPGQFAWTDGSPSSYSNWDTGQPDSGGSGNDCAVLTVQQGASGGWNDVACTAGSAGWTSFACSQR